MTRRLDKTLADYVAIAISPVLIMTLVGSLLFFLVEVFYRGRYPERMLWIFFWFTIAIVLIGRISIELGKEKAGVYAGALAIAVLLAMSRFAGGSLFVTLFLIGLVWWAAHKLTWDCTLIDETEDASGEGLMQTIGLDEKVTHAAPPEAEKPSKKEDEEPEGVTSRDAEPLSWWERLVERERRPHAPGVWIVYFSLAALPIFGIGQLFVPKSDQAGRRWVFLLLLVYVASGLGLLLSTSFLGLRRYLRQRHIQMPVRMAAVWLGLGCLLIVGLLFVAALLPRPGAEVALPYSVDSPDLDSSRYAVMRSDPADKDKGGPRVPAGEDDQRPPSASGGDESGSQTGSRSDQGPPSGSESREGSSQGGSQGEKGGASSESKGDSGSSSSESEGEKGGSSSESKGQSSSSSSDSKGEQGGSGSESKGDEGGSGSKSKGEDAGSGSESKGEEGGSSSESKAEDGGSQSGAEKEKGDSGSQSDTGEERERSGSESRDERSRAESDEDKEGTRSESEEDDRSRSEDSDQRRESRSRSSGGGGRRESGRQSDEAEEPESQTAQEDRPSDTPSRQPSFNPQALLHGATSWIATLFKWIFYGLLLAVVVYFLWRSRAELLTTLRGFLQGWREFWQRLFGGKPKAAEQPAAGQEGPREARLPGFADFTDPFLAGTAGRYRPDELVKYSFDALEAWARDHGCPRGPEQTPHEFARQISAVREGLSLDVRRLADLYCRVAYAPGTLPKKSVAPLRELWYKLQPAQPAAFQTPTSI